MKQGTTFLLKGVIVLIGLGVLAVCVFILPQAIFFEEIGYYRPIVLGLYVPAVPFFIALYQAIKLLGYIDANKAFSNLSVNALKKIKYCAIAISTIFAVAMPYIFYAAQEDDAPGVAAVGLIIIFASIVIATFAAVLQKLLKDALDIKSENDLTV